MNVTSDGLGGGIGSAVGGMGASIGDLGGLLGRSMADLLGAFGNVVQGTAASGGQGLVLRIGLLALVAMGGRLLLARH